MTSPPAPPAATPRAPPGPASRPAAPVLTPGRPSGTGARHRTTGEQRACWVLLAVLGTLSAIGIWQHVMWFDELQAWNIARASRSVGSLYAHLRYEGHPIGWYLPLYVLTRFTGNPRALQALELAIVVATTAVVLLRAPWSLLVRVAIVVGYYLSFEYGAISRSYGLGVLALVLLLAALGRERPAWGLALGAAVALAWTSVAGALVAVTVAVAVVWTRPSAGARRVALGTVVAGVAATLTCLPPADFHQFTPGLGNVATVTAGGLDRVARAATGAWRGLVPIPARLGGWNTQLLDRLPGASALEVLGSVALFVAVLAVLRPTVARRVWCLGNAAAALFFLVVVLPDQSRYAGLVFLLFLAACWLAAATPGATRGAVGPARVAPIVAAVLAAQVVAALAIYPSATLRPFSPDRAIASAARSHGLADRLVSGDDFDATTVSGYLDRPTYSVARGTWQRYFVHDDRQAAGMRALTPAAVVCAAGRLADATGHDAGALTDRRLAGVGVRRVSTSGGVSLYAVGPAAVAGCPPGAGPATPRRGAPNA